MTNAESSQNAVTRFVLRIPNDLKDQLTSSGQFAGRSLNSEIIYRLYSSLDLAQKSKKEEIERQYKAVLLEYRLAQARLFSLVKQYPELADKEPD